jgi:hypothetical protein
MSSKGNVMSENPFIWKQLSYCPLFRISIGHMLHYQMYIDIRDLSFLNLATMVALSCGVQ